MRGEGGEGMQELPDSAPIVYDGLYAGVGIDRCKEALEGVSARLAKGFEHVGCDLRREMEFALHLAYRAGLLDGVVQAAAAAAEKERQEDEEPS